MVTPSAPQVVVLGEVLLELASDGPLARGATLRLDFTGDALTAAASAAAAGAATALVARIPDDELGDAIAARVAELGIDARHLVRVPGQHGIKLTQPDPGRFSYARAGSAGSTLSPDDLPEQLLREADVVVGSGITAAVSAGAAAAVEHAATLARAFVYDPNYRARLSGPEAAGAVLRRLAPLCRLVTPSWPDEAKTLLGALGLPVDSWSHPRQAAAAVLALGARTVAMTCGEAGVLVLDDDPPGGLQEVELGSPPAPVVVDQTGAGDCFVGNLAARLASGDGPAEAALWAAAAASLSVQGRGGTGFVPTAEQTRAHLNGVVQR